MIEISHQCFARTPSWYLFRTKRCVSYTGGYSNSDGTRIRYVFPPMGVSSAGDCTTRPPPVFTGFPPPSAIPKRICSRAGGSGCNRPVNTGLRTVDSLAPISMVASKHIRAALTFTSSESKQLVDTTIYVHTHTRTHRGVQGAHANTRAHRHAHTWKQSWFAHQMIHFTWCFLIKQDKVSPQRLCSPL